MWQSESEVQVPSPGKPWQYHDVKPFSTILLHGVEEVHFVVQQSSSGSQRPPYNCLGLKCLQNSHPSLFSQIEDSCYPHRPGSPHSPGHCHSRPRSGSRGWHHSWRSSALLPCRSWAVWPGWTAAPSYSAQIRVRSQLKYHMIDDMPEPRDQGRGPQDKWARPGCRSWSHCQRRRSYNLRLRHASCCTGVHSAGDLKIKRQKILFRYFSFCLCTSLDFG